MSVFHMTIKNRYGFIFGGYTAVPWSSPSTMTSHSDSTAFLFSLKNPSNNPLKLKVIEPDHAVHHHSTSGFLFGRYDNCRDLSFYGLDNSRNCMNFKSYESPNGKEGIEGGKYVIGGTTNQYEAAEIEVFHIF